MKINPLLQFVNLAAFIAITTITTISTVAQTAMKPVVYLPDTARQAHRIHQFDVQLQPDNKGEKFVLSISNPFGEKLKIAVSGSAGAGFSDQTSELTYRKRINMTGAEEGSYSLTVSSGKNTITKTFTLSDSGHYNRDLTVQ